MTNDERHRKPECRKGFSCPFGAGFVTRIWSLSIGETSGFAGGLAQFDSSRNGSIGERVVRAVSPHSDPLPRGEGTPTSDVGVESQRVWRVLRGEKGSPSPQGPQGRGLG